MKKEEDLCTKLEKITSRTFALNWKKISEEMDLCIKLEKITNRTFALNWKKISEKLDLCIKLEKNRKKGKVLKGRIPLPIRKSRI